MGKVNVKNGDIYGEISMPDDLVNICIKSIDICFSDPLLRWCATALIASKLQKRADRLYQKIPPEDFKELEKCRKEC